MLSEEHVDAFVARYIKDGQVLSIGTNQLGELFLKKVGLLAQENHWSIQLIPTSTSQIQTAQSFHIPITNLNDREVDVAIEFVTQADHDYNFIKRYTTSLVRDKMIAQSSGEMIIVLPAIDYVEHLSGFVPFEISSFGWKRTLLQLEQIGKIPYGKYEKIPPLTESGHYLVEAEIDSALLIDDIDAQARLIPGVLETGLFIGQADRIMLVDDTKIEVKSRME